MADLDFRGPFDELCELREVLTTSQIAELTGLRRETISRARPDSHFRRSTERALGDLYAVVTRMRVANGGDLGQLAAVLRRPQPLLGERSISELLREGRADIALRYLDPLASTEEEQLEDLQLDPAVAAGLRALEAERPQESTEADRRESDLIAADPELARAVESVEERIRDRFGAEVRITREAVVDHSLGEGNGRLYLRVRSGLPFDQELDLLNEVLDGEKDLLAPTEDRLTIGNL